MAALPISVERSGTVDTNDPSRWELPNADELLSPGPLHLETGIVRLPSGPLNVATRVEMPNCKGRMLDWWFKYFHSDEQFRLWNPIDHREFGYWDDKWRQGESYIGATTSSTQSLMGVGAAPVVIKFHDPAELFSAERLAQAFANGDVSAIVCAYLGNGADPPRDERGNPLGGRFVHIARDNDFGCVVRSRYFLGAGLPPEQAPPDEVDLRFLWHSVTEYGYLARALPSVYWAENRDREGPPVPW